MQDRIQQQQRSKPALTEQSKPALTDETKRYGAMRAWASFLYAFGIISAVFAAVGAIVLAIEVHNFWQALGVLLIGGPISVFLATLPIAISQSMNALADVAETVTGPDLGSNLGGPGL